jgi:hypothetical protein
MKKILLFLLLLPSCSLIQVKPENGLTPFPKKPEFVKFVGDPIVRTDGKNYVVIPEFVSRTTQEHLYLKSVLEWKTTNGVKE